MKGGKYAKTLAKIQVRGVFYILDIGIYRDLYGDAISRPLPLGERSEPCSAAKRPTASDEVARGRPSSRAI